jgi:OFA family oxalate/formate antiporter-like MFS transporter
VNRWFRVAGGVGLNLCLGAAYVYSVFLTHLQREFGWTRSELSVAFTLSIAFIAAAGLMVIGPLAAFALGEGFSARDAALSVGVLSVGNGCGRIASGWMSDHIGRIRTLSLAVVATVKAPPAR